MKRFVFRLAALERLREARRRDAGARLAQAMAERARLVRAERELAAVLDGAADGAPAPGSATGAASWKSQAEWDAYGRRRIAQLRERVAAANETIRELGVAYEAAARERQVLERIHDRRRKEWRDETEREETRWLAEIHQDSRSRRSERSPGHGGHEETE